MSNRQLLLLHGPNLNLLGSRQPEIYGSQVLEDVVEIARTTAAEAGFDLEHHQSNFEGELIELIHSARSTVAGLVINAGALTHYSWSLHDALAAFDPPAIELHLSNPAAREPFRHVSVLAPVVQGSIAGFGSFGYKLAVDAVVALAS